MAFRNIHFFYDAKTDKQDVRELACELIASFGQAPLYKADLVVSIGGDGTMLQALQKARKTPVLGLTPVNSNSTGFWTEHSIRHAEDLRLRLMRTAVIPLIPVRADITFENGRRRTVHAFNDVSVSAQSAQAVITNLTAEFSDENKSKPNPYQTPQRVMGDGLIFSTAIGSTGTNRSYHGPVVPLQETVLILTGKGVYAPENGIESLVLKGTDSKFSMDFVSSTRKRPLRIDYDGHNVFAGRDGSAIVAMKVRLATEKTAYLLRG